jgi:hypothetical protein
MSAGNTTLKTQYIRLHLISNEESLPPGWNRAMKDIVMFNPVVTIFTPIPKWLHPPHRFE